jgi:iron complex outermembrane recepter protein
MWNRKGLAGPSLFALAAFGAWGATPPEASAQAQAPQQSASDEIVVTGSLIRGASESSALPVDVISAEELAKQGSPSALELIKSLSVSTGVLGDTNQFETRAQGSEGSGSINLRGLGSQRTLVLINGRRMTANPFGQGGTGIVDTNIIPTDAIGRIEVLKDGAAATYGSDAIGGVVNFITRKDFDGFEVGGSYRYVDGAEEPDYTAKALWGWQGDRSSIFISGGYQHRGELRVIERDYANASFTANPQAGWSTGSSVTGIIPLLPDGPDANTTSDFGTGFLDPACGALGGIPVATAACRFQFLDYDNLVEKEDRYQIYGELNTEFADGVDLHVEGFYSKTDVPEFKTSPGYVTIQAPTSLMTGGGQPTGGYFVPISNPALTMSNGSRTVLGALLPSNAVGAYLPGITYRTFSFGGNPLFGNGPGVGQREYDAYRVAGNLTGTVHGIDWDLGLTFSQETAIRTTYDAIGARLQLAMRGFGSLGSDPNGCTAAETNNYTTNAGNTAIGCNYFNPFSNAIPANVISGEVNNVTITGASPAVLNSPDLVSWIYQPLFSKARQNLLVADAAFSGETPITLPGGEVQWAVGGQFRRENYNIFQNDFGNSAVNRCIDTPVFGNLSCATPQGPFHFLGATVDRDETADVYAIFGELQIPLTDALNFQVAARYEDYGGEVGSTFNPKISGKWQVTDFLAFRGSAGSTFRGPPQTQLGDASLGTSFEFINGNFRAVNNFGNPALEPETADTLNVGAIFETGNLKVSLDYYSFDFDNPIVSEQATEVYRAMFPGNANVNCNTAAFAGLQSKFFFFDANSNGLADDCGAANISQVTVRAVNGAAVKTNGLDLLIDYSIDEVLGGTMNFGATFTYVTDYKTEQQTVAGILVAPAFNAVGKLNFGTTAFSLPRIKGNMFAEYNAGIHNLRATLNYIDEYRDQRGADIFSAVNPTAGKTIDSFVGIDLDYRASLPQDLIVALSVDNVTDEDPPFARLSLSYDPTVHNALGRTIKVGVSKKF